ncbi:hypothetical protein MPTK1_1g03500 [Marchantia polymorpha subsp. ruderalis]|uniref:Uncharacterized protein n=2 Tax=Marchantia polymorpha TaxID=3197 RepID=A0AAF6AL46_MARPO|nr:hypothetical protein MARPO_0005s0257 [Marchantia polymorpha]BBM97166.1 hypothetical protein Mp_1g03500 [Marchantia polymorpha subsp. ruderalis]|eukprot:PTQ48639.1 hypothetical protein MARPO_0005s0257 [Marchantia polymorpha]
MKRGRGGRGCWKERNECRSVLSRGQWSRHPCCTCGRWQTNKCNWITALYSPLYCTVRVPPRPVWKILK